MTSERTRQITAARARSSDGDGSPSHTDDARATASVLDLGSPGLVIPSLLAGLAADDGSTRRSAAYAAIVQAREESDAIPHLAAGLVERVVEGDTGPAVLRTLASLDAVDERPVQRALIDALGRDRARQVYRAVDDADAWELPDSLERDLAAVDDPSTTFATDFRQVVRPDPDPDGDPEPETVRVQRRADDEPVVDPGTAETSGGPPRRPSRGPGEGRRDDRDAAARVADSQLFTAIRLRSVFDELTPLGGEERRRYASVVRTKGVLDGEEHGVALRLYHRPEGAGESFDAALVEALADWERLADAAGTVHVFDWGDSPRPWVATEFVEDALAEADRPPVGRALAQARRLTGALVRAHDADVVHGGIDPRTVVFSAATLDAADRPLLDNVGVGPALLAHRDPGAVLDPRYAAPEHVDPASGGVDRASDIYGLGMVLYRLCTGRAPFAGRAVDAEDAVLNERPRPPSEVDPALPDALDEVVARATGKRKLTRYETATRFHQDICRLQERFTD